MLVSKILIVSGTTIRVIFQNSVTYVSVYVALFVAISFLKCTDVEVEEIVAHVEEIDTGVEEIVTGVEQTGTSAEEIEEPM